MKPCEFRLLPVLVGAGLWCGLLGHVAYVAGADLADRPARISPDYADVVLPPNIAPLNFRIKEPGSAYRVNISAALGRSINVTSDDARIIIPPDAWRTLLEANRGGQLTFDVAVRDESGNWLPFGPITNTIASEDIDRYLAYRLFKSLYRIWVEMNIYQRDLEGYDQRPIWRGRTFRQEAQGGCIHCHTFRANRTDRMALSYRDKDLGAGVILAVEDQVINLNTKFGYTAWHPSGKLVAYSRNKVRQFFHHAGVGIRDVVDLDSSLAYYVLETQTVKSNPKIDEPGRLETYPTWSPDGDYLYFSSAPILWTDPDEVPPKNWDKIRYDLRRIRYDIDTDTFGEPETILSAARTGRSILIPRVSPDGRFLVFTMCDYGCFPINLPDSDLYIMDLQSPPRPDGEFEYRDLGVNSDWAESWHSWSTNSRWLVFSSKRIDGLFARPHFTYIDADGKAHKPLVMPQQDPSFYDALVKTYTLPEFTVVPVMVPERDVVRALHAPTKVKVNQAAATSAATAGEPPPRWDPSVGRE